MNGWRLVPIVGAAAMLFAVLAVGMTGTPPFGYYAGPYGDVIIDAAREERHVLNAVTAVNFDYRGFDTLGEEFIFFASMLGVALLLRDERRAEQEADAQGPRLRHVRMRSAEVVSLAMLLALPATLLVGAYIVLQGHLSPGGGFQGGVIISAAALLIALTGGADALYASLPKPVLELLEACGIGSYLLVGFFGPVAGKAYLTNVLPLGRTGSLLSSGTIWLINLGVGLAVSAGFLLLTVEFVQPLTRAKRRRGK